MLKSIFVLIHLVGLAFGLGGVTVNFVLSLKARGDRELSSLLKKVRGPIGKLIFLGLVLLTLSGIGFVYLGYPLNDSLTAKLVLVAALWVVGPSLYYLAKKLSRLAPEPSGIPSAEFLSARKKIRVLNITGLILWYAVTILGVLMRT